MKKSLKKLALNKKAVSSLTEKIKGGFERQQDTINGSTTDPTANTRCFDCPPPTI